jgi:hypothetical protein
MHRGAWLVASMVVAAGCVVAVSAGSRDDLKAVTVTGCVQNFSSTGTSGVTERGFLLSNPMLVPAPGAAAPLPMPARDRTITGMPTGTSGTAAAGMPTSDTWAATTGTMPNKAKTAYRLDGNDEELKAQVGHKVEIDGAIEPRQDSTPKSDAEHLRVVKIKMLESNCAK